MYITQTLHQALAVRPNAIATVYRGRETTVATSYDRIARFASALQSLGVQSDDVVGILALNSDKYHEYLYAVPWSNGIVNPINIRWSVQEVVYSLIDSNCRVVAVDDSFIAVAQEVKKLLPHVTLIYIGEDECPQDMHDYETLIRSSDRLEDARRGGDRLLGVFYTGGTTGHPKGVLLTHDNLMISALSLMAMTDMVEDRGRVLHVAPLFHLADLSMWCMGNFANATHVFSPSFTPEETLKSIQNDGITDILLVPVMLQMIVDLPRREEFATDALRHILYGASPISEALLNTVREVFPVTRLTQVYGMTELAPAATVLTPDEHCDPNLRRSAGRPALHTEVRIVSADGHESPPGVVGEIVVRGDNVMVGYLGNDEATESAIGTGWMHTGDVGYIDTGGYLYVVDRIKDMIITGGENVYSSEVENALAQHGAVEACAVVGLPDEKWGERVHAVVVVRGNVPVTDDELIQHCRRLIGGYKVPRSISFVDSMPVSAAGKILKRELREQCLS
ncbi:long-chain-fatty-acid--CoA ligase [Mycolicibacterium fortuitum]|uniref:long-chain-fatty-acid--CoA ligase n=1 Tax=Mycolicibacterium fortuitum TaxID=1766 RepID=UPI0014901383|nr:long-chain fatty acid--CoA ligase [Mycolicibacterium fortuitum]